MSPLLILLGLKGNFRCRATAQTFCVLLACASSAFLAHVRVLEDGEVVGAGSCGNAGLLVMAAGLDLSGEGGDGGLALPGSEKSWAAGPAPGMGCSAT